MDSVRQIPNQMFGKYLKFDHFQDSMQINAGQNLIRSVNNKKTNVQCPIHFQEVYEFSYL